MNRRSFVRGLLFAASSIGLGPSVRAYAKKNAFVEELSRDLVLPGEIRKIGVTTSVMMSPERLIIPSNIAKDFVVLNILVAGIHQLNTRSPDDAVPGIAFAETSLGVMLKMDTAREGQTIELIVKNVSRKPKYFASAIVGVAKRSSERLCEYVLGFNSRCPIFAESMREVDAITPGSEKIAEMAAKWRTGQQKS